MSGSSASFAISEASPPRRITPPPGPRSLDRRVRPVFLGFTAAALAQRELATILAFSSGSAVTLVGLVLIASWLDADGALVPTRGLARYGGGGLLIAGGAYLLWV